jgi:hypothetical protein
MAVRPISIGDSHVTQLATEAAVPPANPSRERIPAVVQLGTVAAAPIRAPSSVLLWVCCGSFMVSLVTHLSLWVAVSAAGEGRRGGEVRLRFDSGHLEAPRPLWFGLQQIRPTSRVVRDLAR